MIAYRHEFKVTGHGYFPVDMLRYDGCFPKNEQPDSTWIAHCLESPRHNEGLHITLIKIGEKDWKPTVKRWESFGWQVVSIEKPVKLP